jgi:hypothetical protein
MTNGNTKPIKKYQAGSVNLAVWKNAYVAAKDGHEGVTYSVTLERRYKDQTGTWQSTSTFHVNDIPKASLLLQKAYEFISIEAQDGSVNGNGGDRE